MVLMETPPQGVISKQEVIEYYIKTVQRVLGKWDYSFSNVQNATLLFPLGNTKHWLVRMDKPGIGVVTKGQMVDYYAQILTKVLGNEKDAQMCIYHVSWKSFCCEIDEESTSNLASVPGVLSFQPDKSYDSDNKNYGVKGSFQDCDFFFKHTNLLKFDGGRKGSKRVRRKQKEIRQRNIQLRAF